MSLHLTLTTPAKVFLDEDVRFLYLQGEGGEMGILEAHTPLISVIYPGELRYTDLENKEHSLAIGSGFVQVTQNQILVVTELAVTAQDINELNYEQTIAKAKEALADQARVSAEEAARLEASLARDIALLNYKKRRS